MRATPTPQLLRPRPRLAVVLAVAASAVASSVVPAGAPAVAGALDPTAADAAVRRAATTLVLAPPSPELPGLPPVSLELADVPVGGGAFRRAVAAYEAVDGTLAAAQSQRLEVDRGLTTGRAERGRITADLAAARAAVAAARSRLDTVEAAIADLGVRLFVGGGGDARLDAALVAEQPSINDQDRQQVLGDAALDVLLAERTAYRARVEAAQARVDAARATLDELAGDVAALRAQRPAAAEAEAAAEPPVAEERVRLESARVLATVEGADFPLVALDAYHRAARRTAEDDPACGLRWWGLAGISRVEGRHGSYGGSQLDERGDTTRRIIGIQLNGTNATRVVADTDDGAIDGDPAFDRAVGPMQFIPETWRRFAADGNEDEVESPFNLYDATLAAARYLCRAGRGLDVDTGLRRAYFAYNHSEAYVTNVLGWARLYEARVELPTAPTAAG